MRRLQGCCRAACWSAVEAAKLKADTAKADLAAEALMLEEEQEAQQAAKKRAVRTGGMRECPVFFVNVTVQV